MSLTVSYQQHFRAIMRLGLPLIGGHLAHFSIGMTDTVMMGWHSVAGLAALVLGSTMFFVLFILGAGFSAAIMPLVASAAVAGRRGAALFTDRWICDCPGAVDDGG